jgi:predicted nucleic acid-binding protein
MRHVFVETNWVVEYAAPAHRKTPAALELLDRAAREEIRLYLPVISVTEARRPVAERFQVRTEADRVRQFLLWARDTGIVDAAEDETTRRVLDRMESRVKADLDRVDDSLDSLRVATGVEVFNLDQEMLERCASLSYLRLDLKPFDQAILTPSWYVQSSYAPKVWTKRIFANWTPIYSHGTRIATLNGNWQNSITKLESPCTETSC